jgi:hypothetical protein
MGTITFLVAPTMLSSGATAGASFTGTLSRMRELDATSSWDLQMQVSPKTMTMPNNQWLEWSSQDHSALTRLKVDPLLDKLRSDPRFANLVRRARPLK